MAQRSSNIDSDYFSYLAIPDDRWTARPGTPLGPEVCRLEGNCPVYHSPSDSTASVHTRASACVRVAQPPMALFWELTARLRPTMIRPQCESVDQSEYDRPECWRVFLGQEVPPVGEKGNDGTTFSLPRRTSFRYNSGAYEKWGETALTFAAGLSSACCQGTLFCESLRSLSQTGPLSPERSRATY